MGNFCRKCGKPMLSMDVCPYCGAADEEETNDMPVQDVELVNDLVDGANNDLASGGKSPKKIAKIAIVLVVLAALAFGAYTVVNKDTEEKRNAITVDPQDSPEPDVPKKTLPTAFPKEMLVDFDWNITIDDMVEKGYIERTGREDDAFGAKVDKIEGLTENVESMVMNVSADKTLNAFVIAIEDPTVDVETCKQYFGKSFEHRTVDGDGIDVHLADNGSVITISNDLNTVIIVQYAPDMEDIPPDTFRIAEYEWEKSADEISGKLGLKYSGVNEDDKTVYTRTHKGLYDLYIGTVTANYYFDEDGLEAISMDIPYDKKTFANAKWFFETEPFNTGDDGAADPVDIHLGQTSNGGVGFTHMEDTNKIRISFYRPGIIYIP